MTNTNDSRLAHFPITFFASVMGLCGLTLAWRNGQHGLNLPFEVDVWLGALAGLVFGVLLVFYLTKAVSHRAAVKAEFMHPVKANFFPAVSISLVLLSSVALPTLPVLAKGVFIVGAVLHLVLTLLVFNRWIFANHYQNPHINPAWFIPVVGNVLMPIVAVPLGLDEIGWFFFSIGIVFWVVLFTIFMHRIFFFDPLPPMLTPTLFILIAPPAVGFVSYIALNGELDNFARILYGAGLFITLFLLVQFRRFSSLSFSLSWWAYSFPMAAITIASLQYYELSGYTPVRWIAIILLALTTVIITGLVLRTLLAILRGAICLPEG